VITYLRQALDAGLLHCDTRPSQLREILKTQYERWWNIDISHFHSKEHFLRYAGRYVRRPPIAQRRITQITPQAVEFLTKDLKLGQVVTTRYCMPDFVSLLGEHIPDRYRHTIRYFGLLAPRTKACSNSTLFLLLKQKQPPRLQRLSWRNSLRKYFGVDPLMDSLNQPMHWFRRLEPRKDRVVDGEDTRTMRIRGSISTGSGGIHG